MEDTKTKLDMGEIVRELIDLIKDKEQRINRLHTLLKAIVLNEGWTIKTFLKETGPEEPDEFEMKLVPEETEGNEMEDVESYLDKLKDESTLQKYLINDFFGNGGNVPNVYKKQRKDASINRFEDEVVELVFGTLEEPHGKKQKQYLELVTQFSVCMDDGICDAYVEMLLATMAEDLWQSESDDEDRVMDYRIIREALRSLGVPFPDKVTFFRKIDSKPTTADMEILGIKDPGDITFHPKDPKKMTN